MVLSFKVGEQKGLRRLIPIEKIQALPFFYRDTVVESYLDVMGHMNVRWYMTIFDEAAWPFFDSFGMNEAYYKANHTGAFALKHLLTYWAEVRLGETVAVHSRIVGRSTKRIHFMHFMVNETTGTLAATLEALGSHADLTIRRTSPFKEEIATQLDAIIAKQSQLDWDAPLSGAIRP